MSARAISVKGISKHYQLGPAEGAARRFRHDTLSETLYRGLRWRKKAGTAAPMDAHGFWALRDVSFDIQQGEVVGIVGRNGSGKSTLLKILSRITEPTSGYADVEGRVGSLLEVGTGFHPQLTGRENIYLNGAILGMTQAEVRRKFDEIVDFSEVERFLDTPVKNYSSGMYTRLAFAVAAYLDTEILIVDEVLAVGDAEFQKKCLGKMQSVADRDGRTVLFVSHNMAALSQLTQRCVLLRKGEVAYVGQTAAAIADYLGEGGASCATVFNVEDVPRKLAGTLKIKLTQLRFERAVAHFTPGEDFSFVASLHAQHEVEEVQFNVTLLGSDGTPVGTASGPERFPFLQGESRQIRLNLPNPSLAPGRYHCRVALGRGTPAGTWRDLDVVHDTLGFEIIPPPPSAASIAWKREWGHVVLPALAAESLNS